MTGLQWFGTFLFGLAIAIVVVGQIAVRIGNMDDSETRLFINYWWLWLTAWLTALLGMWLMKERERS